METKFCAVCAWRGTCQIKFSRPDGIALHCLHFSHDVGLQPPGQPSESADAVICGCGVGGLALGLLLARHGYHVILLERESGVVPVQKPEVLQPQALAWVEKFGGLTGLLARGPTRCTRYHFYQAGGRPLLSVDCAAQPSQPPYGLVTFPHWTREALLEQLRACSNVRIIWGADLNGLLRRGDAVTGARAVVDGVERSFAAPVVIGADGATSRVRAALDIPCHVHPYPDAFVTMLVDRPEAVGDGVHYYLSRRSFLGLFPISREALCLLLTVKADSFLPQMPRTLHGLKERAAAMAPAVAEAVRGVATWEQVASLPCVCMEVSRWVTDGAALMGDSAHACHPYMALGTAQALEDAWVLGDVLDGCFRRGDFSARALAPYEAVRRPAVERLQRLADRRVLLWNTGNPLLTWARTRLFRAVARHPRLLSKEFIANTVGVAQ